MLRGDGDPSVGSWYATNSSVPFEISVVYWIRFANSCFYDVVKVYTLCTCPIDYDAALTEFEL